MQQTPKTIVTAVPILAVTPLSIMPNAGGGGATSSIQMSNMITQMLANERQRRLDALKSKSQREKKSEKESKKNVEPSTTSQSLGTSYVGRVRKTYFKLGRTQQSKLRHDIRRHFLDLAKSMLKPMGLYLSNIEVCPIEAIESKGKPVVKMDESDDDDDDQEVDENKELDTLDQKVEFKLFDMEQFMEFRKSKPSINKLMFYKDKFSISDKCYAQLHKHCSLPIPPLNQIKKWRAELDSLFKIYNNEMGVFLSFEDKLRFRLMKYFELKYGANVDLTDDQYFTERGQRPFHDHIIHVKLSADGTNIGRNLKLLNFTFTILNEGAKAKQAAGNYTLGIFEIENESHASLAECFKEIVDELSRVNELEVNGRRVKVVLYYGADWKMLAIVLGLLSANSKYPCVWCKCPKEDFHLVEQEWSIVETDQGARSPQEQRELVASRDDSKKKSTPYPYSYQRNPIFGDLIPYSRYMIDMLHLFLRISDTLFNLLIKDCSLADQLELTNLNKFDLKKYKHMNSLQHFLNEKCNVRFQFYWVAETKKLTWRDLTGPEKHRLFDKFNLAEIMPDHERFQQVEKIWFDFYEMLDLVKQVEIEGVELKERTTEWLKLYLSVYSKTTVTPYMHAFVTHLPEFVHLYKDINAFTCQGLEKLNDMTTGQFFKGTNKLDTALHQVLKKRNRMELLCTVDDNFDN